MASQAHSPGAPRPPTVPGGRRGSATSGVVSPSRPGIGSLREQRRLLEQRQAERTERQLAQRQTQHETVGCRLQQKTWPSTLPPVSLKLCNFAIYSTPLVRPCMLEGDVVADV